MELARPDVGRAPGSCRPRPGRARRGACRSPATPSRRSSPWSAAMYAHAQLGGEVRILAVGLLDPAPARVAADVQDGRQGVPGAGQRASAGGWSPRPRRPARCRTRPRPRSTAGSTARPRPAGRAGISSWMSAGMPSRVSSTRKRWMALAVCATSTGRRLVEPARRVSEPRPSSARTRQALEVEALVADDLERPERPELGELLGQGHPSEQVGDALVDGARAVAVRDGRTGVGRHRLALHPAGGQAADELALGDEVEDEGRDAATASCRPGSAPCPTSTGSRSWSRPAAASSSPGRTG